MVWKVRVWLKLTKIIDGLYLELIGSGGWYFKLLSMLHLLQSVYLFETHVTFMFLCTKGSVQQLGLWNWVNAISYKKDAELIVETYFRLKEKKWPLKGHSEGYGGGKQKTLSICRKPDYIYFFYFHEQHIVKLFYLLSALWKIRVSKKIQASRQNIILIAQIWLNQKN